MAAHHKTDPESGQALDALLDDILEDYTNTPKQRSVLHILNLSGFAGPGRSHSKRQDTAAAGMLKLYSTEWNSLSKGLHPVWLASRLLHSRLPPEH